MLFLDICLNYLIIFDIYSINMFTEVLVLWKIRKTSITIPLRLHEKIAQSCPPIAQIPSAVVCVRPHVTKESPRTRAVVLPQKSV